MMRRILALLVLLAAVTWSRCQSLPPVGPGDYVIQPGSYVMTGVLAVDVNVTQVIRGNCTIAGEVCVWIDLNSFGFNLTSANSSAPLEVSGVSFTNSQPYGMAALRLSSLLGSLNVNSVGFSNASTPFISGFPPASANLSYVNITDVTASTVIDIAPIYNPADPNFFPFMNSLRLSNVRAEHNLPLNPTTNDSLISLKVQVIDVIEYADSIFTNNTNLLRIGDSPVVFISDGVSQLLVRRCSFSNHRLITSLGASGQPQTESPLFLQTTTSTGPTWIIEDNTLSQNEAPFLQFLALPSIVIQRNHFINNPNSLISNGMIKLTGALLNNTYVRSGMYSLSSDPSATTNTQLNITNDLFDFQMEGIGVSLVSISTWSSVHLTNVTFQNILPGNVTAVVSAVYFERVNNVTVSNCEFMNISFSNVSGSGSHAGRMMVGFTELTSRTTIFTLSNNLFGSYDLSDTVTADIVAQAQAGLSGTLRLISSPSTALLNMSRLASTTNVEIRSPLIVSDSIFNKADFGIGSFTLFGRLFVPSPLVLFGRVQLTLGPRADFTWTPSLNGTIQVDSVPTFTPKVIASSTVFGVDLGNGLSVPIGSLYVLVSQSIATLPTTTSVVASWSGKTTNPGFTGTIIATNSHVVSGETYSEITMDATPLCSISCVVGACNTREFCTCSAGWSGTACTCLDSGRPAGAQCGTSTTSFEWFTYTPQSVSPTSTLLVPSQLTYYVNSDMSISGTLHLNSGSKLVILGQLSVSGNVIMDNDVLGYPYSCDFYTPTMIFSGSISTTNMASFVLNIGTASAPVCIAKKRDFANDNYDALVVVNSTAQIAGTMNVDARNVDVPSGKQQMTKLIAIGGSSQIDLLTVTVQNKTGICSETTKTPSLLSVTFTVCNGTRTKVQWWWYGAPIIGVVVVLIVFITVVFTVPKYKRAIFPYSAK